MSSLIKCVTPSQQLTQVFLKVRKKLEHSLALKFANSGLISLGDWAMENQRESSWSPKQDFLC